MTNRWRRAEAYAHERDVLRTLRGEAKALPGPPENKAINPVTENKGGPAHAEPGQPDGTSESSDTVSGPAASGKPAEKNREGGEMSDGGKKPARNPRKKPGGARRYGKKKRTEEDE